jgi:hypothetical protein
MSSSQLNAIKNFILLEKVGWEVLFSYVFDVGLFEIKNVMHIIREYYLYFIYN